MNRREAWLYLASVWDNPTSDRDNAACVSITHPDGSSGCMCYGLCTAIRLIVGITIETRDLMLWDLVDYKPDGALAGELYWPTTKEGAKERAAFCRKMAERRETT